MTPKFADPNEKSIPIDVIAQDGLDHFMKHAPQKMAEWVRANGFIGKLGQLVLIPEASVPHPTTTRASAPSSGIRTTCPSLPVNPFARTHSAVFCGADYCTTIMVCNEPLKRK